VQRVVVSSTQAQAGGVVMDTKKQAVLGETRPGDPRAEAKKPWSTPEIHSLDISETRVGAPGGDDGFGLGLTATS
jgi:hypothetical protein